MSVLDQASPVVATITAPLLAATRLEDLLAVCETGIRAALGPAAAGQSLILWFERERHGRALVLNRHALLKRRYYRSFVVRKNLLNLLYKPLPWLVVQNGPAEWVEVLSSQLSPIMERGTLSLALPLRASTGELEGAWIIGLSGAVENMAEALELGPRPMAPLLAQIITRVIEHDRLAWENQQTEQVVATLQRLLTGVDRNVLLGGLLDVFVRQFGFTRASLMLLHEPSASLRSELHTGFDLSWRPATFHLEDDHTFVQSLHEGRPRLFERGEDTAPSDLPSAPRGGMQARCVLVPLRLGDRPVGLLYADQAEHGGLPLFISVLDTFGRLAAVAIENLRLQSAAESRAESDALTGLRNRRYLDNLLKIEVPRVKRYNQPISLLMIDLCNFKYTNDTHGHSFGDFLLRETARLLQANIRRPDIAVRYGGDEFVVLMFNTSHEQALQVRERIEGAFIERNRLHRDPKMMISISLGLRSADASNIDTLIHEADMEMYAQKSRQRRRQLSHALIEGEIDRIEASDKIVASLCRMLYNKCPDYPAHARRVAHLALLVARQLEIPESDIENLALAALLHDIGKASLPTSILQKSGPLSRNEREALRHHAAMGEEFFQGIEHLEPIRPLIRHHHERWDGRQDCDPPGYPEGLKGKHIPLGARILAAAEYADRLIEDKGDGALDYLKKEAGAALDPEVIKPLLRKQTKTQILDPAMLEDPRGLRALACFEAY